MSTAEKSAALGRLLKVHPDPAVAGVLYDSGYHSALQIANVAPSHFVRTMASRFSGNTVVPRRIHARATQIRSTLMHAWANVKTAVHSPQYNALAATNVSPEAKAQFQQLPSYQDLFGTLNYCDCEECRSIFGAAAYLVDLLRIIDTYVTIPNATIPDYLKLETRRGDLGRIPLTCENTNDTFPQLRIVNERLSARARNLLKVPESDDLFETIAGLTYPFNLPFHLPLAQIAVDLGQIKVTVADIYRTFAGPSPSDVARGTFGLSPQRYALLTKSLANDPTGLAASYGGADLSGLSDVGALLAATGLTLVELQALLMQDLSAAEFAGAPSKPSVATNFYVNGGLAGKTLAYVPADPKKKGSKPSIANLPDNDAFDRISRFLRLAAQLGWDYAQLDWALRIANSGNPPDISTTTLPALADMVDLARQAQLDIPALCALLGPVKTYGAGAGSVSTAPFDVIFNDPRLLAGSPPYHPGPNPLNSLYQDGLQHWDVGTASGLPIGTRLAGSLGVNLDTLNRLGAALFPGVSSVPLTVDNLSALYRHAVVLRTLGLPADQYFLFMQPGGWLKPTFTTADLRTLFAQNAWLAASGLTVYQIDYFLNATPTSPPNPYVDPLYRADSVDAWLETVWQATANLPVDAQNTKLESLLAAFFGISTDTLASVMSVVVKGAPPPEGLTTWQQAFLASPGQAGVKSQYIDYINTVLVAISRWLVLTGAINAPMSLLNSLGTTDPKAAAIVAAYGLSQPTLQNLKLADVVSLSTFVQQMQTFQDKSGGLISFVELSATKAGDPVAPLAQATGWDPAQTASLLQSFVAAPNSVAAIAALQRQFALMRKLGADVQFIITFNGVTTGPSSTWADFTSLADLVLTKVKAVIPDAQWDGIAQQIDGAVAEQKRNVLAPLVLAKLKADHPEIDSLRHLSEYLLIDVEVSGVRQISYIREALNAAQLYLQRCRLRLEEGVEELDIPEVWWEWMMNYRIWEANREIFLYPENYIDPTLRQSKTRLFRDLENQLAQDAITDASADTAFRTYIDSLCKLARLVYVDAYHGTVNDPVRGAIDTTFLFARTATQPYTYYYISYDTGVWSEWKQLDVTIPAALITPVYAFNHLFIFWVELKTSKPSTIDSSGSSSSSRGVAYTATIKFSFTTFNGSWIQPQALIADEVVYFMPSETQQQQGLGPLASRPELFRMADLFWNKVAVNMISGGPGAAAQGASQKLCVMYGPFLDKGLVADTLDPPSVPAPVVNQTSSQLSFQQKIFDISTTYNQFFNATVLGHLPMTNTVVLDRDLNPSFLGRGNEVVVVEKDFAENAPPIFKPEIDVSRGVIKLVGAGSAYQSNYLTDYTPAVSSARLSTPVTATSFVSDDITAAGSQQTFNDLVGNNVVNGAGAVDPNFGPSTDLSFLFAGADQATKDKLTVEVRKALFALRGDPTMFSAVPVEASRLIAVKNQPGRFLFDSGDETYMLTPRGASYAELSAATSVMPIQSSPLVFDDFFKPVDAKKFNQIFLDLVGNNVIAQIKDPNTGKDTNTGWLSPYFDSGTDLSFLFGGAPAEQKAAMIAQVRRILLDLPSLTVLRYVGNNIRHVVRPDSFITNDIQAAGSQQIFNDLQGNYVIDQNGVVSAYFSETSDLSFLFGGNPNAQLTDEVRAVLLRLPKLVQPNSFVSNDIDAAASQAAYSALGANNIIDSQGLVAVSFGPNTDLTFLFPQVQDPQKSEMIGEVRAVLMRFYYSVYEIDINELKFDVERVSARASSRELSSKMFIGGVDELLALDTQNAPIVPQVPFDRLSPNAQAISPPALFDGAQIDFHGPYGLYYWELFFHVPMLVANGLTLNQQNDTAKKWLEYILNPTAAEAFVNTGSFVTPDISLAQSQAAYAALLAKGFLTEVDTGDARVASAYTPAADLTFLFPEVKGTALQALMIREVGNVLGNFQLAQPSSHFWQFRPFRNHTLESLHDILTDTTQITTYNDDPFDPHAIARLRIGAYEKSIVMKYVDNLIAWGDMLFTQYTWESITNAWLLYMYANDLLGDKPEDLGPCANPAPLRFNDIKAHYDAGKIPQFFIDLENWVNLPASSELPPFQMAGDAFNALDAYFCVPENDKLSTYWDRVEDRLFKIRNGLNIDGVAVPLALFDPPIDPMALVRMAASGAGALGLAQFTQTFSAHYRFSALYEQAAQLTSNVMQLGSALLSALERSDAERLEVLHQTQELAILDLTTAMKQKQIEQLEDTVDGLVQSRQNAKDEVTYYTGLKSDGLSSREVASQICQAEAILFQAIVVPIRGISIAGYLSPSIFGLADGGMSWGDAIGAGAEISGGTSQTLQLSSQLAANYATYDRRAEDWQHQIDLNNRQIDILQKQIDATNVQIAMARQDLAIHKKSIDQANAVDAFLRTRFTSVDLYQWMTSRIATIYFQAYRMAVDAAKTAELAYQYELNQTNTFINFSYWDSLKKGLLAGETLNFSLQQLKQAYMDGNSRSREISKTVSLLQLDPQQILNLRAGQPASFNFTETMFDFDFPGHYARQIATIAISIPAVVGPYQNVNATLTQTQSRVLTKPDKALVDYQIQIENTKETPQQPAGMRDNWLPNQSIAISRGVNDSGMFEFSFGSDRYLPFEGTGAVSSWTLAIPPENNRINLEQLTDVIIELKYTALDDGSSMSRDDVIGILRKYKVQFGSKLYLNLRQTFSSNWYAFMNPQGAPATQTLTFALTRSMFPYFKSMTANLVLIKLDTAGVDVSNAAFVTLMIGENSYPLAFGSDGVASVPAKVPPGLGLADKDFLAAWSLQVALATAPKDLIKNGTLAPVTFRNFELILSYSSDVLGPP